MTSFQITHEFAVRTRNDEWLPAEGLHRQGERLMEALLDLEKCNADITDPSTASAADRGVVVAELLVQAATIGEAVAKFLTVVRTAIHAVGGATPDWDDVDVIEPSAEYEPLNMQVEYV
jgi:hypothetical protein